MTASNILFTWDIAGDFSSAEIVWGGGEHYPGDLIKMIPITENVGQLEYALPPDIKPGHVTFTLRLRYASEARTIKLTCRYQWGWGIELPYTHSPCPFTNVLTMTGAYQAFERGYMIWIPSEPNADTNASQPIIFVFYDDGTATKYYDTWDGDDYSIEGVPDDEFLVPERGFGYLWNTQDAVRSNLGWAISSEQSYDLSIQRTASYDTYLYAGYYMTLPNGTLVQYDGFHPNYAYWTSNSEYQNK
jgi:hypothetical protein